MQGLKFVRKVIMVTFVALVALMVSDSNASAKHTQ